MSADPLALLRDIHLPPETGGWPPAPIFVLAAAVLMVALAVLAAWRWRARRKPTLARRALRELTLARQEFAVHADASRLARDLSGLLRRTALARHGDVAAAVCGPAWAKYLAQVSPPGCDPALWDYLAVGRYTPSMPAPDPAALLSQCGRWLRQVSA